MAIIAGLVPENYQRSVIHGDQRTWIETNCYVDVLVELIHALGFDPIAGLAFTVSVDFECDQWTFFKYPPADLLALYGFDVQELNPWNDLAEHTETQVRAGRPVLVELDSYFLPDTAGSSYQIEHVKSTVAVNEIDLSAGHMGYFHGQGYYHVDGDDFQQLFHRLEKPDPRVLPPYIELVKLRRSSNDLSESELLALSIDSLTRQVSLIPSKNPFEKFIKTFRHDLDWLLESDIATFHRYSFATLRQYGACFELASTYMNWLVERGVTTLSQCADSYQEISTHAKTLQFKLARAIARKKDIDFSPLHQMSESWQTAADLLKTHYSTP